MVVGAELAADDRICPDGLQRRRSVGRFCSGLSRPRHQRPERGVLPGSCRSSEVLESQHILRSQIVTGMIPAHEDVMANEELQIGPHPVKTGRGPPALYM